MKKHLKNWKEIRDKYTGSVIFGNGFSVSVSENFHYGSLFDSAVYLKHLDQFSRRVFASLDTQDFEYVLRSLSSAQKINLALEIEENTTKEKYESIRLALIKTVQNVHPNYTSVKEDLKNIEEFMWNFDTIFSLNYDLLIYWAILIGNDVRGKNTYKDCFMPKNFAFDKVENLRKPYQHNEKSILVFYPHGNLALSRNALGEEYKVRRDSYDLLDELTDLWRIGTETPLFVSEGESDKKLASIRRNPYLNYVYHSELRSIEESLCIFGWSASEQDNHIVEAIKSSKKLKRIAISVYDANSTSSGEWISKIYRKLKRFDIELELFDSGSIFEK